MLLAPFRLAARLAAAVFLAGVAYYLVSVAQVWQAARLNEDNPTQAIVVLGSAEYNGVPSPDLAARLGHALVLWHAKVAPLVVTTGGRQPGDVYTEASAGAGWLVRHGVPESSILQVARGRDTWQSLSAVAAALHARGVSRIVLVSDPFHDERIRLMTSSLGLHPQVSPTRSSPIRGASVIPYFAKEAAEVAVGRVVGFRLLSQVTRALVALGVPSG